MQSLPLREKRLFLPDVNVNPEKPIYIYENFRALLNDMIGR